MYSSEEDQGEKTKEIGVVMTEFDQLVVLLTFAASATGLLISGVVRLALALVAPHHQDRAEPSAKRRKWKA